MQTFILPGAISLAQSILQLLPYECVTGCWVLSVCLLFFWSRNTRQPHSAASLRRCWRSSTQQRSWSMRPEARAAPRLSPWAPLRSPAALTLAGWTRSWPRWRRMYALMDTLLLFTSKRVDMLVLTQPICEGIPDCGGRVWAGRDLGRPGAVCSQYQQRHHRHWACLPGGPGGHCRCSGPAVRAAGSRQSF